MEKRFLKIVINKRKSVGSKIVDSLANYGSVLVYEGMGKVIMYLYWSSKPDKIKRDTVRGPPELGGTGLINITCII